MSIFDKVQNCETFLETVATNTGSSGLSSNIIKVAGTAIAVNSGNLSAGVPRVAIATNDVNMSAMKTDLDNLSQCVTAANKIKTNLSELKDGTIASNSGNKDNGTLRVVLATDDINSAAINASLTGNTSGDFPAYNIVLRGIRFGASDQTIQSGGGAKGQGTLTVTIADDDTPLGLVNSKLDQVISKLTDMDGILNDVYVSGTHSIKTST